MMLDAREVTLWLPPGRRTEAGLGELADLARSVGGAWALDHWLAEHPGRRAAYVHGERHGLWWEFRLIDSFRWQGHVWRLRPALVRQRIHRLTALFGLTPLLDRSIEQLTPAERARADLAVALLPQPELLVWEEPLRLLSGAERSRVSQAVREICHLESTTVLAIAAQSPGLRGLGTPALSGSRAAR